MTFVYPWFLWALAAVAVPVIIHLFNFRKYKKVYFTNVKFLRELQEESKSRTRLKEILVLLARCFTIACLVIAFAQPALRDNNDAEHGAGPNALSLYIDNSFSTQNVNKQGPVFDIARQRAREVVRAYGSADRFQIITNDFEGRHQRFLTREGALSAINEIKVSSSVRNLSDVLKRQAEFMASSTAPNKKLFVFSDAQRSTFNIGNVEPDTLLKVTIVPVNASQVNNVYVDSCWFETPLQQKGFIQKLHARIINKSNNPLDIGAAKLFLNGQQVALASFSTDAGADTEVKFTFECKNSGFNYGSIKIEDYPVTFDDEMYFAFNSRINIAVCLINGKDKPATGAFSALFKSDSIFKLTSFGEQTIDYAQFKTSDVIVLNQLSEISSGLLSELVKFTLLGGSLLIVPPPQSPNFLSYNTALTTLKLPQLGAVDTVTLKTNKIELASGFYLGVFEKIDERVNLPIANRHYKLLKNNRTDFETILALQNGDDFFGYNSLNNATLYLLTSAIDADAGNFGKHALFVPTIYRLCFSALKPVPLFYPVSTNVLVNLKSSGGEAGDDPPHIKQLNGSVDMIPELRTVNNGLHLYTRNQVSNPGFYEITRNNQSHMPLAFNYSRVESNLESYSYDELVQIIGNKGWRNFSLLEDSQANITGQVLQAGTGKKIWKLFLLLALGFILVETTLLRLLK